MPKSKINSGTDSLGRWVIRGIFILVFASIGYFVASVLEMNVFKGILAALSVSIISVLFESVIGGRPLSFIGVLIFGSLLGFVAAGLAFQVWTFVMGTDFPKEYFGTRVVDVKSGMPKEAFSAEEQQKRTFAEVENVPQEKFNGALRLTLTVLFSYIAIAILYRSRDQFNFIIPYVEFRREERGLRPMLLDTSVIIDGRIADICQTGVIDAPFIVPQSVINELQGIADSSDKLKRNRGRRGLDVLNKLRQNPNLDVQLRNDSEVPGDSADRKLVILAKQINAKIMTNDFNLNKVAKLEAIEVVNINDLAGALKPVALPGEDLKVKIIRPGEEAGQGVGFLDDGTMVVVDQGRNHIGKELSVTVTSTLNTSAGRMIFARPHEG
ncbi:MAG TPA: PIN/TRAM domain-containing protein [Candidatus Brocadiia bacterium]|nr:PIN/TRAM domain-containing protein [Candidatus Brocadiia bacterium]